VRRRDRERDFLSLVLRVNKSNEIRFLSNPCCLSRVVPVQRIRMKSQRRTVQSVVEKFRRQVWAEGRLRSIAAGQPNGRNGEVVGEKVGRVLGDLATGKLRGATRVLSGQSDSELGNWMDSLTGNHGLICLCV
jgi:hypothetical protein